MSLAVIFDSNLLFSQHISKTIKISYSNSNRHSLNKNLKKLLWVFGTLKYYLLQYSVAHYLTAADRTRIDRVQISCLRFMYGLRGPEYVSYVLERAGLLRMEIRHRIHKIGFFHKVVLKASPPYLYNKITFRTNVHNFNLRHNKNSLTIPKINYYRCR